MAAIGKGSSDTDACTGRRRPALLGAAALSVLLLPLLLVAGAAAAPSFTLWTTSPTNGATVAGSTTWQVDYAGATPTRVSFYADGAVKTTDDTSPFAYQLDTRTLGNTSHLLKAVGVKGNFSAETQVTVTVSNGSPPTVDTTPPTAPSGLRSNAATATTISLAWNASTDNTGVSGYNLYLNGNKVATGSGTTSTVGGLGCSSPYVFAVEAFDAAGNVSGRDAMTALTGACASGAALRQGSTITAHRICSGCATTYAGDLSRYGYVILQADQYSQIATLKAKNPKIKMLVYKNAIETCSYDTLNGADRSEISTGVGYYEALSQHPEWFLQDTTGSLIVLAHYPSCWMMDWGSASYQQRWTRNVIADAKAHGWDGVLIDDANWSEYPHLASGQTIAKYPTNAEQTESMRQFLAVVGPELQKVGLLALPNIFVDYPDGPTIFSQWIGYTSGAYQEYWSKSGSFSTTCCNYTGTTWDYHQSFLRITEQANKVYIPITKAPSTDIRSMEYARANFYLDWDGGPSSLSFDPKYDDPWNPYWTTDLGMPVGAKVQVGSAWRRNYERGAVVVNPTSSGVVVGLGGSFRRIDGTVVSSLTLDPATAAVLLAG
jgi:Hypothetical glycosyl hydrolase family 15/Bacterial Ig domain